jgi:hypothetical protein
LKPKHVKAFGNILFTHNQGCYSLFFMNKYYLQRPDFSNPIEKQYSHLHTRIAAPQQN